MGYHKLTNAAIDNIKALHDQGLSNNKISTLTGICRHTIKYHLLPPDQQEEHRRERARKKAETNKDKPKLKHTTSDETIAEMKRLKKQGLSDNKISQQLNVDRLMVAYYLKPARRKKMQQRWRADSKKKSLELQEQRRREQDENAQRETIARMRAEEEALKEWIRKETEPAYIVKRPT